MRASWGCAATWRRRAAWRRSSRCTSRSAPARRRANTRSTTARKATSSIPRGGCACSCATSASPKTWRRTCGCCCASSGRGGRGQGARVARLQGLLPLLHRFRPALPDALGGYAELARQIMQRGRVFFLQPARLDDAPAAGVERGERARDALGAHRLVSLALELLRGLGRRIREVVHGRVAVLVLVVVCLERHLAARETGLHLHHFLGLDLERRGDAAH